jgi:hypothetical protein
MPAAYSPQPTYLLGLYLYLVGVIWAWSPAGNDLTLELRLKFCTYTNYILKIVIYFTS